MTKYNKTSGTAHLSLTDSVIWAGRETPDGRELDEVRKRVRSEVQEMANATGKAFEIYSCRRHGECRLDVVDPTNS